MSETPAQVLERILAALQSEELNDRLAALHELERLTSSSAAILDRLECMALYDPARAARQTALSLLGNRAHRLVRSQLSTLPLQARSQVLAEIDAWQHAGIVVPAHADVLRRRYDFDMAEPASPPMPEEAPPVAAEAQAAAAQPAPAAVAPRAEPAPTLTQRLLSQSTVNVFLYLGAFLVIGAALILAALVQAARLPILSGVAVVFAASAVLLKKRLPQPSFALFIVFSFLLPILARVLGESLQIALGSSDAYWSAIFLLMAVIWAASVWFYSSRLFSLASFVSLGLAAYRFAHIFTSSVEWMVCVAGLTVLAGLAGAALLRRWKDDKFAQPLLMAVQAAQLGVLAASLVFLTANAFQAGITRDEWLAVSVTWLLGSGFYFWSTQLYKFPLFPWAAAAALLPAAWFTPAAFTNAAQGFSAIYAAWGVAMAAASELLRRVDPARRLRLASLPLLFAAVILLATASFAGFLSGLNGVTNETLGFEMLAGSALVCTVLHVLRPRKALWFTALLFAIAAYFAFFALPMFHDVEIPGNYLWLGLGLLLMLPELFMNGAAGAGGPWRQPLIVLGSISVFGHALTQLSFVAVERQPSIISFGLYAALALAYAVHFRRIFLLYFAAASTAAAVLFALWPLTGDQWLPVFTGLAALYYLGGLALSRLRRELQAWAGALRISGLALGTVVVAAALLLFKAAGAPYVVAVAAMFFAELYLRPEDRLEPAGPFFLGAAALLGLPHTTVSERIQLLMVISLLWVVCDAAYERTLAVRRAALVTRAMTATVILFNSLNMLIAPASHSQVAVGFAVYAAFAAFDAWYYRLPALGYAAAAFIPLSVFFGLRAAGQENWLYGIVVVAVLYYAAGYVLRRRGQLPPWSAMLLYSGLGLGTLNALTAPLHPGLPSAIPVAIAATLFALEAFARSNVWLGFPANLLYLEAYFLILLSLKVDEPQFYSVGAALLGILMHYLLTRAGSKLGAFLTGMFSQLVLLGTTYIQLVSTERLGFFVVIFLQGLVTLGYGIVIRSRSLLITPIIFIVLSVIAVVYGALKGISTVILIGCSGILLLLLGILAVVLRERLARFGDRWSSWRA